MLDIIVEYIFYCYQYTKVAKFNYLCYDNKKYWSSEDSTPTLGDRKRQLAGRLSDKMSSELGYYLGNSRVILFCGGYYGFRNF